MTVLTTINYGRYVTTRDSAYNAITADNSQASVYGRAAQDMWVVTGTFWGGRSGGTQPDVRISVYNSDASKNPTDRVGYMQLVKPTNAMTGAGSGGALITSPVEVADNAPSNVALMLHAGKRYAIDFLPKSQGLGLSFRTADFPAVDNPRLYSRVAPGDPPPVDYTSYVSSSPPGHNTAFLTGHKNEPPEAPVTGLAPIGTISSLAPTFTADFRDINGHWGGVTAGANDGDIIHQYRLQVRAPTDIHTLLWNSLSYASEDEQAANAISKVYGGTTLVRGTAYEWRIQMSDAFYAWGSWSAWTAFSPSAQGFVTLDSTPTGKVLDNTPDFKGRWNHQAATSMKRVQVRLRAYPSNTVLQTGADFDIADVASSALPGTLFTVLWANTGFTPLAWGTKYRYEMRGYDGTLWSDWSGRRYFNTDAAPSIARNLSPPNGALVTVGPTLQFSFTDADPDDTYLTTLQGYAEIFSPIATVSLGTAVYNPTIGRWEVTGLGAFLTANGFGQYRWDAYGYDGTLYSGNATVLGSAVRSPSFTFDYEAGPIVAITSPSDGATIATANLIVTWAVSAGGPQVTYRVRVYAAGDDDTAIYDSLDRTSDSTSHTIPSGYLRNGLSYNLSVTVTNATPLSGTSDAVAVAVSFTPPVPVINLQIDSIPIGHDPFATANRLTWDQTVYDIPDFQEYTIYRSADDGPDQARIIVARITAPGTLQYVDYTPASGYTYTYEISVTTQIALDAVESDTVFDTATIALEGMVLTLVANGGTYRACLLNCRDRSFDRTILETVYLIDEKPVTVRGIQRFWTGSFEGIFAGNADQSARAQWDELDALDAQQGTVCLRDSAQRKQFLSIANLKQIDVKPEFVSYTFTGREESEAEGVV